MTCLTNYMLNRGIFSHSGLLWLRGGAGGGGFDFLYIIYDKLINQQN